MARSSAIILMSAVLGSAISCGGSGTGGGGGRDGAAGQGGMSGQGGTGGQAGAGGGAEGGGVDAGAGESSRAEAPLSDGGGPLDIAPTADTSTADAPTGTTACTTYDDCGGAAVTCDITARTCSGCKTDADCRGGLKCETATGLCRDCVTDADCADPVPVCSRVSWNCTARCTKDADCPQGGYPNKCHTGMGICLDCTGNGMNCKYCELETYSCVGCLLDSHCPASKPKCGPSYLCTPACATDAQCPPGLFCHPGMQVCLECVTNKHCRGGFCQPDWTCG